nr:MAG TPA: hypothetical protein [Caudoviricetes sp.]
MMDMDKTMRGRPQDTQRWIEEKDWATDNDMPLHPLREGWKTLSAQLLEDVAESEIEHEIVMIWKGSRNLEEFLERYARRYLEFDDFEELDAAMLWRMSAFEMRYNMDAFEILYNRKAMEELACGSEELAHGGEEI